MGKEPHQWRRRKSGRTTDGRTDGRRTLNGRCRWRRAGGGGQAGSRHAEVGRPPLLVRPLILILMPKDAVRPTDAKRQSVQFSHLLESARKPILRTRGAARTHRTEAPRCRRDTEKFTRVSSSNVATARRRLTACLPVKLVRWRKLLADVPTNPLRGERETMQKVSSFRQSLLPKNTITQPKGRTAAEGASGRNRGGGGAEREMAKGEEEAASQCGHLPTKRIMPHRASQAGTRTLV